MVTTEQMCRRLTKTFQHLDEKHDYLLDKRASTQFRPFQNAGDEDSPLHSGRQRNESPPDDSDIKFEQKLLITDKAAAKTTLVSLFICCCVCTYTKICIFLIFVQCSYFV